jgi:hypothetical protein
MGRHKYTVSVSSLARCTNIARGNYEAAPQHRISNQSVSRLKRGHYCLCCDVVVIRAHREQLCGRRGRLTSLRPASTCWAVWVGIVASRTSCEMPSKRLGPQQESCLTPLSGTVFLCTTGFGYALIVMDRFSILYKLIVTGQMTFYLQLIHSLSKIYFIRLLLLFFPRAFCCHISVMKSFDFKIIPMFLLPYKCRTRCLYLRYGLKAPSIFAQRKKVFENLLFIS